jgi:hypothetical protein
MENMTGLCCAGGYRAVSETMGHFARFSLKVSRAAVEAYSVTKNGGLVNRKISCFLLVCLVTPVHFAVAAPQRASTSFDSPSCKKPAFDNMIEFRASACEGKRGAEFDGLSAKPRTLFDGMVACAALKDAWREYCTCWGKQLRAKPVTDPKDLRFKVFDCSAKAPKPTMWVYCGHFACGEAASSVESTSSAESTSSESPGKLKLQDNLMGEYVP